MEVTLQVFRTNLARARDLGGLYASLGNATTSALDLSDLLRAQVVLGVSAFDAFIHEITRLGMLQAAAGTRPVTPALQRFQLPYGAMATASTSGLTWLDAEIRNKHGFATFQAPDKVAEAIRLVSEIRLWDEIGRLLSRTPSDVTQELRLIVDRRNKIAHEADSDPSFPQTRWPIEPNMTARMLDFLEALGESIFRLLDAG